MTEHGGNVTEKQDSESTSESSGKGQKTDESGHVNAESKQSSGCVFYYYRIHPSNRLDW